MLFSRFFFIWSHQLFRRHYFGRGLYWDLPPGAFIYTHIPAPPTDTPAHCALRTMNPNAPPCCFIASRLAILYPIGFNGFTYLYNSTIYTTLSPTHRSFIPPTLPWILFFSVAVVGLPCFSHSLLCLFSFCFLSFFLFLRWNLKCL